MSVARHTEITAASTESFEDAVQQGVRRAAKTVRNLRSAWIKDQKVLLTEDGAIQEYRVDMKITFILEDG